MTWEFTDFLTIPLYQFKCKNASIFLTIFDIIILFWQFRNLYIFFDIFDMFDIYWHFLTFLTVFDSFWQFFWQFLTFFWPTDQPTDIQNLDVEAPSRSLKTRYTRKQVKMKNRKQNIAQSAKKNFLVFRASNTIILLLILKNIQKCVKVVAKVSQVLV